MQPLPIVVSLHGVSKSAISCECEVAKRRLAEMQATSQVKNTGVTPDPKAPRPDGKSKPAAAPESGAASTAPEKRKGRPAKNAGEPSSSSEPPPTPVKQNLDEKLAAAEDLLIDTFTFQIAQLYLTEVYFPCNPRTLDRHPQPLRRRRRLRIPSHALYIRKV